MDNIFAYCFRKILLLRGALVVSAAMFFVLSLLQPARATEFFISNALPAPTFAREWMIEDKVKIFDQDTLFDHINGEAELFFPYGFKTMATASYANEKNSELSVVADVYQMASALDAFGIYSNYRKTDKTWVTVGAEGFISDSQLLFYQNKYFVRLQASGTTSFSRETFLALARAISDKLPAGTGEPRELAVLKIPALVPKSERYLAKSLLGYEFFRRGMIADAVAQNEKMQIFALREDTTAAASRVFDQYRSYLQAQEKEVQISGSAARQQMSAIDPLYGKVLVRQAGRYIIGVIRIKNDAPANEVLQQLRRRVDIKAGG